MSADVPDVVRQIALVQILAGLSNIFVFAWLAYLGLAIVCGIPTLGLGMICALAGLLLVPFGLVEVFSGALLLTNPRQFLPVARALAYLELGGIFVGAIGSVVAGGLVLALCGRPEVRELLSG